MKLIYLTDSHWKDEEPFYLAAEAMSKKLVEEIKEIAATENFILVHGGDVFDRSRETGRVNDIVFRFFKAVQKIQGCVSIYVIQGNHDVKKETGSALDSLLSLGAEHSFQIIKEPSLIPLWDDKYLYALPYAPSYSFAEYKNISSYGDPDFHERYLQRLKDNDLEIAVTSGHFGDETTGKFFKQIEADFLPGIKCHGHIHKKVSERYVGSVMITRRDEIDKVSYIRVFDNDLKNYSDVPVGCAFNFLKIRFGENLLAAYEAMKVKPYGSVIVDVEGHDDEAAVVSWFNEERKVLPIPAFLGSVYPDEKQSDGEFNSLYKEGDEAGEGINIKSLFAEFCEEKKTDTSVRQRIEAVL